VVVSWAPPLQEEIREVIWMLKLGLRWTLIQEEKPITPSSSHVPRPDGVGTANGLSHLLNLAAVCRETLCSWGSVILDMKEWRCSPLLSRRKAMKGKDLRAMKTSGGATVCPS